MKRSVLTRYRVMSYVTGVLLIVLTLGVIGKLLKIDGAGGLTEIVGIAHGWLYIVYLIFAFELGSKAKYPIKRQLWVLLAGTIPTAVFFVERRVTREMEQRLADATVPVGAKA